MDMQVNYPKKSNITHWNPVNVVYPVRKCFDTGISSETRGRVWRNTPEVIMLPKLPVKEERDYIRDYNVTNNMLRSQSSLDFGYKIPEVNRFNKNNSCIENLCIYPPSKKLKDNNPAMTAHGTSVMKSSFSRPVTPSRLVTDKDQFKHPSTISIDAPEPCYKGIEPLDTTYDGFEKYLDPYLTTSRLHHRPFTAEQLNRPSNSKDVLTYYTYADTPWVRSPKPKIDEWNLPVSKYKSIYDREKFKDEFREIRTHNSSKWVPGAFRTENKDNYVALSRPESNNYEEVKTLYKRSMANLQTNIQNGCYKTENSQIGSRKPICSVLDQYVEKNKRLAHKSMTMG